jgi:hypothetical protein
MILLYVSFLGASYVFLRCMLYEDFSFEAGDRNNLPL